MCRPPSGVGAKAGAFYPEEEFPVAPPGSPILVYVPTAEIGI